MQAAAETPVVRTGHADERAPTPHGMERILACLSSSDRTPAVVAEAWRFARAVGGRCHFLHVGSTDAATVSALRAAMAAAGVPADAPLTVRAGSPVDVVCDVARRERIGTIVAGILNRHTTFGAHFRSTAGRIAAAAPCSVLLLTSPQRERPPLTRFAVTVDYEPLSRRMLTAALAWGRREGVASWDVLHEHGAGFFAALNAAQVSTDDRRVRRLRRFIEDADWSGLEVNCVSLVNRHGCDALWHARASGADVLCMAVSRRRQGFWERMLRFRIDVDVEALPPAIFLFREPGHRAEPEPGEPLDAASVVTAA